MESWESEYNRAISEIKYHHGKKYEMITYAANQLILGGFDKERISAKLKEDLKGIASDRYIEMICADLECTRTYTKEEYVENEDGTVSVKQAGDDRDSIPKDDIPPRERFIAQFKKAPNGPENLPYADHLMDLKEFLEDVIEKLKSRPFLSALSKDGEALKDYSEFITVSKESIDLARQEWDDRNTVPVQKQYKLLELVTGSTIKHGAKTYIAYAKEQAKISSKQVTKILYGRVRNIDKMYEPNSREDAKESGYSGVQCTSCDSWRVRLEHGWAKCFACENEFESKPLPLGKFKEEDQE